jgi:hypothetical protein
MNRPITIPTTGRLDKDSDFQYVQSTQGNYIHMQDMDMADSNFKTRTTTKGTLKVLDFGNANLQNQLTRININELNEEITITLRDGNNYVKATVPVTVSPNIDAIKLAITNFLNNLSYAVTIDQQVGQPFIDFRIDFAFADYSLSVTGCSQTILEEAISQTGVGQFMPIGSYDLNGDVFYWLTTQRNLIRELSPILNVFESVNSQIGITSLNHGLQNFETVAINAVNGVPTANGIWTVTVINDSQFFLNNSSFAGTYTGGGQGYADLFGYGCIGVMLEDVINDSFQFIPLLRSKELNLVTKKEIYNPQVEVNGDLINAYFTDFYNNPRVFYYEGDYIQDGALRINNPLGQYAYGTIAIELRLQQSFTVDEFEFIEQQQTGGATPPGNWRYAIRFLDENFAPTEPSLLTNPIPNYLVPYEEGVQIYGNENIPEFVTPKINRFRVSGILAGAFKYIELIGVNYSGGQNNAVATVATIIRQEVLGEDQTSIILEHNGNEPDIRLFDARQLLLVQTNIELAADLTIIENRLVLENIVTEKSIDFQPWIDTWKYSLKKRAIPAVLDPATWDTFNEFYDPQNTYDSTGYQIREWYRLYAMIELQNGKFSDAFFFADIRFLSQVDYDPNEFISTNLVDKRNLAEDEFTNYSLGNADPYEFLQYYVNVNNIDWSYQIEGKPVRDFVKSIRICRAERVKEVLASGVVVMGTIAVDGTGVRENPQAFRVNNPLPVNVGNIGAIPYNGAGGILITRRYASFYSPDIFLGAETLPTQTGLKLINFGAFGIRLTIQGTGVGVGNSSVLRLYNGNCNTVSPQIVNIVENKFINKNSASIVGTQTVVKFATLGNTSNPFGRTGQLDSSNVFLFEEDVTNQTTNFDSGVYHSIVFRELKDKYGSRISNNDVIYCGTKILVEQTSGDVFGGDVFTQQTYYKPNYFRDTTGSTGYGAGLNLISQNVVNTNLRTYNSLATGVLFPIGTQDFLQWLEFDPNRRDQLTKNSAYSILNQIQEQPVYNPDNKDNGKKVTRKYYSQYKPTGSRKDFYRIFYPFDFADNPQKAGQIVAAVNFNNRLFTLQERGFTIEYFNDRGRLATAESGEVIIGDGAVLPRVGNQISAFGTQHRGSVLIGKSQSGKDVLYYISVDYGEVLRFGDDGLRSISQFNKMRLFFKDNLKWAKLAKTPADGYGITSVWDNRQKRAIWTVKAWKPSEQWIDGFYSEGDTVIFGEIYQGVPQLWSARRRGNIGQPSDTNLDWIKHDIKDNNYYNCYTVVWSEIFEGGGFEVFLSFLPNHYTQRNDSYFSAYPDLNSIRRSELFIHNLGLPATYYDIQFNSGIVKTVVNVNASMNKKFFALMMDSSTKPEEVKIQVLFRNFEQDDDIINDSFLLAEDFDTRESFQYSPIKAITDSNGSNDGMGGQVEGIWCTFEIIFPKGKLVTMNDIIVKIRDSFVNAFN